MKLLLTLLTSSEKWLDALQYRNFNILAQQPSPVNHQLCPFFPEDATQEMQKAFGPHYIENLITNSSSRPLLDDNRDVPPLSSTTVNPYTKEYQDMVIKALNLENNSNLNADKQNDLEALVRKYAHIFMLPGAPFHRVVSPEHTIDTGDASPKYQPLFAQSPAQLQIMKIEIHNMVTQRIQEPSSLPWGAPCLLVKKNPENGIPVPPRLVYDYHRLNKVTKPDVYPFQTLRHCLTNLAVNHGLVN